MHKSGKRIKIKNKISATIILMMAMSLIYNNAYSLVRNSVSTGNWNQTSTWDCGCIPASTDSVIISGGNSVTVTINTTVKGMTIRNNGTLLFGNGITLSCNGSILVETGGTLNGSNDPNNLLQFTVKTPRFTSNGTASLYRIALNAGSNSSLCFYGSGVITIDSDLEVYGSNPKVYNYYVVLNVKGNIVKNGSGTFQWQQRDYSTLNLGGNFGCDDLFSWTYNTINYNGAGDQTIKIAEDPSYYWHLSVSGSGTKTLGDYEGALYFDIHGNLTISANCTLDASASSRDIRLLGNWINNGGTFNARNGTVFLESNAAQTISDISGIDVFYDLSINKSANDVILGKNISVTNSLNLSNGDIVLGSFDLTLNENCTVTGTPGVLSYVHADGSGVMKKMMNTSSVFTYHIGDNDEYSPLTVDLNNATFSVNDFFSVRVTDDFHPDMSSANRISRYWTLNCGGFTAINYDVSYNYLDADIEGDENNIYTLKKEDEWITYEKVNAATNTLFSNSGIIVLPLGNDFTGGNDGTLPVELTDFTAIADDEGVNIAWQTASETNNDFFTIEKSTDGLTFVNTAVVDGAGNSNSLQNYSVKDYYPYDGVSYYRLKQTDYDGQYSYSSVVAVVFEDKNGRSIIIFPSPSSSDNLNLSFKYNSNDTVFLNVYDINGTCFIQKTLCTDIGENTVILNTSNFAGGKYIIQIMGFNRLITSDFIKY
ncbi:MAG: T9SS type A sorting domain-containing protein [Bacteroidota bacterium]